jgi:hypothetical protein
VGIRRSANKVTAAHFGAGVLVLLLCAAYSGLLRAQAWPQPRGHAYVKFSYGSSAAEDQFDASGERKPYDRSISRNAFLDRSFYLYAEYGLFSRLTLIAQVPFKRLTVRTAKGSLETSGFGTVSIGIRYGLVSPEEVIKTGRAVSALVSADLPTGYVRNRTPSVGAGQTNVRLGLSVGQSLYPFPGYLQAGLSYRIRTSEFGLSTVTDCPRRSTSGCFQDQKPDYGDEWIFLAEAGFTIGDWILIQGIVHGIWSNAEPLVSFDPLNPIPTRQRLLKTGIGTTIYPGYGLGLSIQGFSTPTGRNTILSNDWFFGIEYKY